MHSPICKNRSDTDVAVIFIHGFMGSPNQFADLADAVYDAGFAYSAILLPGHGGGIREFVKFGADDWQAHLQSEIEKIRRDYNKIILVGHSMGGLLALNACLIKENNISGVVLIATPLKVYLVSPKSVSLKLHLLRLPKTDKVKSAYMKSTSVKTPKPFIYPPAIKTIREFYKLMRQTKKRLAEVSVPVCMFHSRRDETTSYRSSALLRERLCNTQSTAFSLDKSWHAFYDGDDWAMVKSKLIEFIRRTV